MKKAVVFLVLLFTLGGNVFATGNDYYSTAYESSGASDLYSRLDNGTKEILGELGIDPSSYETFTNTEFSSFFAVFKKIFTSGIKTPLKSFSLCFCLLLLGSIINGMWTNTPKIGESYNFVLLLSVCTVVLFPMCETCRAAVTALKTVCDFMLAFIPIFAGVLISSGAPTVGGIYGGTMLGVCEIISQLLSNIVTPIIGMYVAVGISACVSGIRGAEKIALKIKSIANWIFGLFTTLFTGFLGIQSVVGKAADNMSLKTAKFFVGSFVPVAGNALSETLGTVVAGMNVLKSTMFSWFITVMAIMILPFIAEIIVWKFVLFVLSATSGIFSDAESAKLFDVCNAALGFLMGITLFVCTLFILSAITVKSGGGNL